MGTPSPQSPSPPFIWPRQQYESIELEPLETDSEHDEPSKLPTPNTTATAPALTACDVELPWRPLYLRRRVLLSFAAVFALTFIAIEVLHGVSNNHHAIASADAELHYLWTYGPTAFLTLVLVVWGRVEYQSKLVAPWIRLSLHPPHPDPSRTLLLDYLSDFQLFAAFKALRNRDFAVTFTTTVAILIKVLIIISTGLITLQWTLIPLESWPMTVRDQFVDSHDRRDRLLNTDAIPYYMMWGLTERNLTYPNGLSKDYAFQSVEPGIRGEPRVTVDGLENSLECQPAELTLR